ncbi:MAG: amino acid adenylation domain-containing protein [Janthinobacterium lividum]
MNEENHIICSSVYQLFEQTVANHPTNTALIYGKNKVSYKELEKKVSIVTACILATAPEATLLGISSSRSITMIVNLLAVLRAGKAYLPLNPSYPRDRLIQIIAGSGITSCLALGNEVALFADLGVEVVLCEDERTSKKLVAAASTDAAYVLYTSGSTGEPKGVRMGQMPLLNLLQWQNRNSRATAGTRTLQFAPLSFDVSFQEIFATLSTGGTLVLLEEEQRLDFDDLLALIEEQGINRLFLPFIALQALAEMAISSQQFPACLQEVMTAGEQLKITPQVAAFFAAIPGCVLYNQYGPTECHVVTQLKLEGPPAAWPQLPTIGQPIDEVAIQVLDKQLVALPVGEVGEICIGGACLADGYLNQPALTQEKFVQWQGVGMPAAMRLYRTGDLGRYLPDGNIEFLGRMDDQVKIRGHRIELGEVEVALTKLAGVKQAVVVAREDGGGLQQLVAYLVSATAVQDGVAIQQALEKQLPDYMIPAALVWLAALPMTTSGKVDKKRLPAPTQQRPALAAPYRNPTTVVEKQLTQLWGELLQLDQVGLDDNFFELGGNSLLAQKTVAVLRRQYQHVLPITKLYQFPTAAGIVHYLAQRQPKTVAPPLEMGKQSAPDYQGDIAVISMAGRFPGAATLEELWAVLQQGRETISFFTEEELDATIPAALKNDPLYVKARGVLADVEQFDAAFFGLNPKLAAAMDPQQRIFLEIAWEALERAGYLPPHYSGRVGVFAGSGNNTYYLRNVLPDLEILRQLGDFQAMVLNEKDYIASRTAYHLNLTGPAVSVYSACSTSLLAITQAVQSLRSGQCEVALAGGASVTAPVRSGHLYQEGAMLSRDGHSRSFGAEAQGTVFSDGAGVVVLKSLAAARRDGDTIYAVIKGVGVTNDGAGKGSFTAPSAEGQAGAIRQALADARCDPATIGCVEAHGTATPLGDPIELEGLAMAFGAHVPKQSCAIGSIKSNMGHLTAAAGVAGFIKAVLTLRHQQLPPSLGFDAPNPHIDFAASPFFVNTMLRPWPAVNLRRAGVSSFGVGGTNVHVVLEEYLPTPPPTTTARSAQLITWSAKTETSREAYAQQLASRLTHEPLPLADVAFTLHTTRPAFAHRRFAVVSSPEELHQALLAAPSAPAEARTVRAVPGETVFLFPGQGSQYLGMGRELYAQEPVYQQAVDACAELLAAYLDKDIRAVMYAEGSTPGAEDCLRNTRYTQPALFVTEYALATLWQSWGIQPTVLCGHSIGEFVAAHLAGVFTLAEALRLVAARGRLISELPGGRMLSVRLPAEKLLALLPPALSLAAINGPTLCVVAGRDEDVAAFAQMLEAQRIASRVLAASHAFHSAMMAPILADFRQVVETVVLSRPQKPLVSTVSGTWLTDAQATDPTYWTQHLRLPVRFADALETILAQVQPLLLEVGPGTVVATLARAPASGRAAAVLPGLPAATSGQTDYQYMLKTLGQLWLNGLTPDWRGLYAGQQRQKIDLPTYAFDKKRCWLDSAPTSVVLVAEPAPVAFVAAPVGALPPVQLLATANHLITSPMRKTTLLTQLKTLLEDASGLEMAGVPLSISLLEIGFDSLLLTQVSIMLKKEFGVPITFRQLNEEYATLEQLATYLDQVLPAEALAPAPIVVPVAAPVPVPVSWPAVTAPPAAPVGVGVGPTVADESAIGLLAQQLHLLAKQVALLQAPAAASLSAPALVASAPELPTPLPVAKPALLVAPPTPELTPEEALEIKKPFGATARIDRQATELSASQQIFLQQLTRRYTQKTSASKAYTQQHRAHMADPRVVTGFKPLTKEIVYPLVVNKSSGSRLWDLDGHEYIDVLNGFGSSLLGHQPAVIKEALHAQIERGYEVGPQHELAGEVSQLICKFTGFERAALCNTGSEAVLGTMRIARTVTGRSLIVAFSGSYHGIVDEVLVRGTKKLKTYPAAPGIQPEAVQNMLILDYGTDESLRIIRERAGELAAVLVEPVQGRRPEFRPVAFLKQVREITAASGICLIFDEVITGFRTHPGGAQALFGIRADLASYGKVVGGGLPIGAIAGRKEYMDALDGGFWQYGDASIPEAGVTYFAGTFVRHPLALAAAKASLQYMRAQGPALQQGLTTKTEQLAEAINAELERLRLPLFVAHFGSLWKIKFQQELPYSELLFTLMREKGIHIWDGFPCFLTEAHTDQDVAQIVAACLTSTHELVAAGFFKPEGAAANVLVAGTSLVLNQPPLPGAKLGRDLAGNPAWFVADPAQPGNYLHVNAN